MTAPEPWPHTTHSIQELSLVAKPACSAMMGYTANVCGIRASFYFRAHIKQSQFSSFVESTVTIMDLENNFMLTHR